MRDDALVDVPTERAQPVRERVRVRGPLVRNDRVHGRPDQPYGSAGQLDGVRDRAPASVLTRLLVQWSADLLLNSRLDAHECVARAAVPDVVVPACKIDERIDGPDRPDRVGVLRGEHQRLLAAHRQPANSHHVRLVDILRDHPNNVEIILPNERIPEQHPSSAARRNHHLTINLHHNKNTVERPDQQVTNKFAVQHHLG